jgi:hypothetical protein
MTMNILRRKFLKRVAAGGSLAWGGLGTLRAANRTDRVQQTSTPGPVVGENPPAGPDPWFERPAPITMAELEQRMTEGVAAVEVSDYAPGGFKGEMTPSPPHADLNPRKAIMVIYKDKSHRLVFCHEASYDPWIELPNDVGLCNQFFEGNNGWAELFNKNGRRERNSFVDIVQSGPQRVWVRWSYFCVNQDDDTNPALRGTEDYISYPNGLVWRRLTYSTLMPARIEGYSWQPIDFFAIAPAGTTWSDLFTRDEEFGDYHVGAVIDAYSHKRYDKFWDDKGRARRNGDKLLLREISQSRGFSMVVPFKAGHLFTIMGAASGFPPEKSQVVDHSFNDTGGWGWGAARWDHWPIGWLNSQAHDYMPGSRYPYHFGPFSHYIINKPLENPKEDFPVAVRDMELNQWSERHVYYTLTGVAGDLDSVRHLARQWLDKGNDCARPESIADLTLPMKSIGT